MKTADSNTSLDSFAGIQDISATGVYAEKEQLFSLAEAAERINLSKATRAISQSSGLHHSNQRGRGMEFLESRHYQPGDDIRSIDWRVTARTGKTHTKVFSEEKEQPVFVVCDQNPYMFFGSQVRFKSVQAANLASLIAWSSLKQGDRFGGEIISPDIETEDQGQNISVNLFKLARNRSRLLQFIDRLSEANHQLNRSLKTDYQALEKSLFQLKYLIPPGTRLYIITDLFALTETALKSITELAAHNQITVFSVFDPLELRPPNTGMTKVSNGKRIFNLLLNRKRQQDIYQNNQQIYQAVKQFLMRWNIPLISVATNENPAELFIKPKPY